MLECQLFNHSVIQEGGFLSNLKFILVLVIVYSHQFRDSINICSMFYEQ